MHCIGVPAWGFFLRHDRGVPAGLPQARAGSTGCETACRKVILNATVTGALLANAHRANNFARQGEADGVKGSAYAAIVGSIHFFLQPGRQGMVNGSGLRASATPTM